jgi:hypothetical protein
VEIMLSTWQLVARFITHRFPDLHIFHPDSAQHGLT